MQGPGQIRGKGPGSARDDRAAARTHTYATTRSARILTNGIVNTEADKYRQTRVRDGTVGAGVPVRLIGLVILTLSLILSPLAVEAQQAGRRTALACSIPVRATTSSAATSTDFVRSSVPRGTQRDEIWYSMCDSATAARWCARYRADGTQSRSDPRCGSSGGHGDTRRVVEDSGCRVPRATLVEHPRGLPFHAGGARFSDIIRVVASTSTRR